MGEKPGMSVSRCVGVSIINRRRCIGVYTYEEDSSGGFGVYAAECRG